MTESVPRHCNAILLKTPEEAIDRLATDSDHHCQILLRRAPTLSLSGGRDDLRTSTIPARAGVKARHLAHVLSEYWEAPIGQIGWEGRAVRLLVEAICNVASTPLRIREPEVGK